MNDVLIWFKRWKIEGLIFAMLFLAGAAFYHPVEYDNTASRYFLLSSIVDYGTLNIDVYQKVTIDKAEWNGHYYSNKAPGASMLGIPFYWSLRHLTPLKLSEPLGHFEKYIVRVMTTTLLFALLGVVMYRLAQFCGAASRQAFLMVVAYGFGSISLLHATLFSGHQIAASFSFFSFALLVHLSGNNQTTMEHGGYGFLAGLLAGLAVITDYTAIVIVFGLAVYAIASRMSTRLKIGFLFGSCVCVLFLAAYNLACFGHPFSSSYEHMTYDLFREGATRGILGVDLPQVEAVVSLLISPSRGIFFIMPVLLLSLWGIALMIGRKQHSREAFLIASVSIGSLLFIAGFYAWHGGWTFGPRYLVPVLPFLAFPIAFLRWRPYIFWMLFIPSCAQVILPVIGVPHVSRYIMNPIVEFIVPCIDNGYTSLNAGMLLCLAWSWSIIAIVVLVGLIGAWAFRESGRTKSSLSEDRIPALSIAFLALWVVIIIAMVGVIRTDPPATVQRLKSQAWAHAADFFYQRGISYAKAGQYKFAIEDFNRTIGLKEDYTDAYNKRGYLYLSHANNKSGCLDAQKACSLGSCKLLESAKINGACR